MITYLERAIAPPGFFALSTAQGGASGYDPVESVAFANGFTIGNNVTIVTGEAEGDGTGGGGGTTMSIDNDGATTWAGSSSIFEPAGLTSVEAQTTSRVSYVGFLFSTYTGTSDFTSPVYSTTGTIVTSSTSAGGSATTTTVRSSTGTTSAQSFTETYTYRDGGTISASSFSTGLTTTTVSFGQADANAYVYNTVCVPDGVNDLWVATRTTGAAVFTDAFQKFTESVIFEYTKFVSTFDFPLLAVSSAEVTPADSTGTVERSTTSTFFTTTHNGSPLTGVRQDFIGTGAAPEDTRSTLMTTSSSSGTMADITGTFSSNYISGYTSPVLTVLGLTTTVVATISDTQNGNAVLVESGTRSGAITTTVTTSFNGLTTTVGAGQYPNISIIGDGEYLDGGMTSVIPNFPQSFALADQFSPQRFVPDAPPGFAQVGENSTAGGFLFRDISAQWLGFGTGNLLDAGLLQSLSFPPWGVQRRGTAPHDYGGALGEQTALTRLASYTDTFLLSFYRSASTTILPGSATTTTATVTTSTRVFSTTGSAHVSETADSGLTLEITIPHTTTTSTSTSTAASTAETYALATVGVILGAAIPASQNHPVHQDIPSLHGGHPAHGTRPETLQYLGAYLRRTSVFANGASTTGVTSHTGAATETAPTDAVVYERSEAIYDIIGLGGGLAMVQTPRYPAFVESPAF